MSVRDAGAEMLYAMEPVAEFLDRQRTGATTAGASTGDAARYMSAVRAQQEKIANIDLTPSAVILDELLSGQKSFTDIATSHSNEATDFYSNLTVDEKVQTTLQQAVDESMPRQLALEAESTGSFDDYLNDYFMQLQASPTVS